MLPLAKGSSGRHPAFSKICELFDLLSSFAMTSYQKRSASGPLLPPRRVAPTFCDLFLIAEASLLMKVISEIVAHMIQAHNSGKKFDVEKLKVPRHSFLEHLRAAPCPSSRTLPSLRTRLSSSHLLLLFLCYFHLFSKYPVGWCAALLVLRFFSTNWNSVRARASLALARFRAAC